jgi:hypothetical protein
MAVCVSDNSAIAISSSSMSTFQQLRCDKKSHSVFMKPVSGHRGLVQSNL